ncbi:MAG: hypothetical protein Crog4KO_24740 [Crocinitomicaceae bacterium]
MRVIKFKNSRCNNMKLISLLILLFSVQLTLAQTDSIFQWNDSSFQVGQTIELNNHLFRATSPIRFDKASPKQLDTLAAFLQIHDSLEIQIESHTDTRGSASMNKWITTNQGIKIARYLRRKGIEPSRMVIVGYGEEKNRITPDSINQFRTTNRETFYRLHGMNRRHIIRISQNYGKRRYFDYINSLQKDLKIIRFDSTEIINTLLGSVDYAGNKYHILIQQGTELQLLRYPSLELDFEHYQSLKIIDVWGKEVCTFNIGNEKNIKENGIKGISLQPTPTHEPAPNPLGWTLWVNENSYSPVGY